MSTLFILLSFSLLVVGGKAQLDSCDNSFLDDLFTAAANYRCIVVRITATDGLAHTTSYTEGSLYYSRYTNSLNNVFRLDNRFPTVDSSDKTCINGIEQPFAVSGLVYKAGYAFDIAINRTGYVTFQSNNVVQKQFDTHCYHNYSVGLDSNGILYVFEFRALPIELPCPTPFGKACLGVGSSNSCLASQIYTGGRCYYRLCSELDCGDHVCINDGGIARCIDTTIPTQPPIAANTIADCAVVVSQSVRQTYHTNNAEESIIDLTFTNVGSASVTIANISISLDAGYPSTWWNLEKTRTEVQSSISFGATLHYLKPGRSYTGVGYILSIPLTVSNKAASSIELTGVSCM